MVKIMEVISPRPETTPPETLVDRDVVVEDDEPSPVLFQPVGFGDILGNAMKVSTGRRSCDVFERVLMSLQHSNTRSKGLSDLE